MNEEVLERSWGGLLPFCPLLFSQTGTSSLSSVMKMDAVSACVVYPELPIVLNYRTCIKFCIGILVMVEGLCLNYGLLEARSSCFVMAR